MQKLNTNEVVQNTKQAKRLLDQDTKNSSSSSTVVKQNNLKIFPCENKAFFIFQKPDTLNPQVSSYIIAHVLSKIQSNQCYSHGYLIFYIPAILITAEQLALYQNQKTLQSYQLFITLVKRVAVLKKIQPIQIEEEQVDKYLTIAINYKKNVEKVKETLKVFLEEYEDRMKRIMPVYYAYFKMINQKEQKLSTHMTIQDAKTYIQGVQKGFNKYLEKNWH